MELLHSTTVALVATETASNVIVEPRDPPIMPVLLLKGKRTIPFIKVPFHPQRKRTKRENVKNVIQVYLVLCNSAI